MGTVNYLILSILCAVLQHEILASPSGSTKGSIANGWLIKGPTPPEYEQGIETLHIDNPTKVTLVKTNGLEILKTGDGLAVHPHFVVVRPGDIQPGCKIASAQGDKIKYFDINSIIRSPKDNVALAFTHGLILLDNGHRLQDGLITYKYHQREYSWVKFTVNNWIKENTLPIRYYRGEED